MVCESKDTARLDCTLNEFGIIPETSGEDICMNEVPVGKKGVCQLPRVRLIRRWLGSLVFSRCRRCERWNAVERNEDFEILLGNAVKCCRNRKNTVCCIH